MDLQTVYFTTANFIRHHGNLVDLTEYRRKLGKTEEGQTETAHLRQRGRRSSDRQWGSTNIGLWLDLCTSGAILAMTVTVVVKVLGSA